MRFHPVISIFLGVIVSFVLSLIALSFFVYFWINLFIIIFSFILGGFLAVFYAREKKIQYALYEGIAVILVLEFVTNFVASPQAFVFLIFSILIFLLAMTGGMVGLIVDKKYRQSFKTKGD